MLALTIKVTEEWQSRYNKHKKQTGQHCRKSCPSVAFVDKTNRRQILELATSDECLHEKQTSQQRRKSCPSVALVDETNRRQKLALAASSRRSASQSMSLSEHQSKLANRVPIVVEACFRYLEANATHCENLFRVPGEYQRVSKMWDYMGHRPFAENSLNCLRVFMFMRRNPENTHHDVASFLKRYIRSMSGNEPIIPYICYEPLVALVRNKCPRHLIAEKCRCILGQLLVPARRLLLARLCKFLNEFSKHAETTQMDCARLAACFFPSVLEPPPEDSNKSHTRKADMRSSSKKRAEKIKLCISITKVLIEQSQNVFRRQGESLNSQHKK